MKGLTFLGLAMLVMASLSQSFAAPSINSLSKELYSIHRYTFFCDHPIDHNFTLMVRDCDTCPPQSRPIKWMKVVPTQRMARHKTCYEQKICMNRKGEPFRGITCCRQKDSHFNAMEKDLHNLAPEDPRLARLNNGYRLVEDRVGPISFICDVRVDHKTKTFHPPAHSRGPIARTYLYMQDTYRLSLSVEERELFLKWHFQYPPSEWEKERNLEIYALQNKRNHWVG